MRLRLRSALSLVPLALVSVASVQADMEPAGGRAELCITGMGNFPGWRFSLRGVGMYNSGRDRALRGDRHCMRTGNGEAYWLSAERDGVHASSEQYLGSAPYAPGGGPAGHLTQTIEVTAVSADGLTLVDRGFRGMDPATLLLLGVLVLVGLGWWFRARAAGGSDQVAPAPEVPLEAEQPQGQA